MLTEMGRNARAASRVIANAASETKNQALRTLASMIDQSRTDIHAANNADVELARASGMSDALVDRLLLTDRRLDDLSRDLRSLAKFPDPVGERFDETVLPNGLKLYKRRVPLGVVGVIYESRPNVTIDVSGLAIKTSNAAILRGGKETVRSNRALTELVQMALKKSGLPAQSVQSIDNPDRALVLDLLKLHEYVDIVIPAAARACTVSAVRTAGYP